MTSPDAYISSDKFFADQFVGIRIRLEHCQDYESPIECASEEEIEAFWRSSSRKNLAVMIFHEQLDMKNQASPLQQTSRVELIEASVNSRKLLKFELQPNEFEDVKDSLGFFEDDSIEPINFFTVKNINRESEYLVEGRDKGRMIAGSNDFLP